MKILAVIIFAWLAPGVLLAGSLGCIYRGITGNYASEPWVVIVGCVGIAVLVDGTVRAWLDR